MITLGSTIENLCGYGVCTCIVRNLFRYKASKCIVRNSSRASYETTLGTEPRSVFHKTAKRIVRDLQERRTKLRQVQRLGAHCTKSI